MLHTHVAETIDEENFCLETYGVRPISLMDSLGWLGKDVWFAHAIYLNEEEINLLYRSGTGIAHCPTSNMKVAGGICRVSEILRRGGSIGIAVDGSASNDGSNLWQEMKRAYLLNHLKYGSEGLTAYETYKMSSLGGARVLGREDNGFLAPGMLADLVFINLEDPAYAGSHDPLASVVNCGNNDIVTHLFINGQQVVKNHELLSVDTGDIYHRARWAAKACIEKKHNS